MKKIIIIFCFTLLSTFLFSNYDKRIVLKKYKLVFKLPKKWGYSQMTQKRNAFSLLYKRRPVYDKKNRPIIPALFILIKKKRKPINVAVYKKEILSIMKIDKVLKHYPIKSHLSRKAIAIKGRYKDPYYNGVSFDRIFYFDTFRGYCITIFFNCLTSVMPKIEKECLAFMSSFYLKKNTFSYTLKKQTIKKAYAFFKNFKFQKQWKKGAAPILKALRKLNKGFSAILPALKRVTQQYPEIFHNISSPDHELPGLCDTYVREVNRVLNIMQMFIIPVAVVNSNVKKEMKKFYTLYRKLRYH